VGRGGVAIRLRGGRGRKGAGGGEEGGGNVEDLWVQGSVVLVVSRGEQVPRSGITGAVFCGGEFILEDGSPSCVCLERWGGGGGHVSSSVCGQRGFI